MEGVGAIRRALVAVSVCALLATACSDSGTATAPGNRAAAEKSVTIGATESTTSQILAALLMVALEDAGTSVEDQIGVGGTDENRDALLAGEIDVYPENVSTGWQIHLGQEERQLEGQELGVEVARRDLRINEVRWSGLSEFDASLGFAATPRSQGDIEDDLARIEAADDEEVDDDESGPVSTASRRAAAEVLDANGWSFGALARLLERDQGAMLCVTEAFLASREGLVRFEEFTGFTVPNDQLVVVDNGDTAEARIAESVADGDCVAGTLNRVSGQLHRRGLVPVGPPSAGLFPPGNYGYSFVASTFDADERRLADLTLAILNSLDRSVMAQLNAAVELDGNDPRGVAFTHLSDLGLVGG